MHEIWIPIKEITATGEEIVLDDAAIWQTAIEEFSLPYQIVDGLRAVVYLIPQEDGCLVRGTIKGSVNIPCDRCTANATITISQSFNELFTQNEEVVEEEGPSPIRTATDGGMEIELGGLLWEEFCVSLPVKPLCKDNCKGLCPKCGQDLNTGECSCEKENFDPRMAALRNLTIKNT